MSKIVFTDSDYERVAQKCHEANVDGVRADLVMLRASRAMAALEGRLHITVEDIDGVADMVLEHRRKGDAEASDTKSGRLKGDGDTRQHPPETESPSVPDQADSMNSRDKEEKDRDVHAQNSDQPTAGESSSERLSEPSASEPDSSLDSVPDSMKDESSSAGEDARWGAMPGQAVPIHQVAWPAVSHGAPNGKKP